MSRTFPFTSLVDPHQVVQLDPWAVNPMLDDAEQSAPATVALARATGGDPPTCFSTGDIPPFTASGVDARYLSSLPWRVRHAAAVEPDAKTVLGYVESHAHEPDAAIPSAGLDDYISRFMDWLGGRWVNPNFKGTNTEAAATAENQLLDRLFGATNDQRRQQLDALSAKTAEFEKMHRHDPFGAGRARRG